MADTDGAVATDTAQGDDESIESQAENLEQSMGQMPIPGTGHQLTLDAGGEMPQTASMKLLGGSLPLEGEFDKGEIVRVWVEGRISEVTFVDRIGADGYVEGTERRHKLRMTRVRRVVDGDTG